MSARWVPVVAVVAEDDLAVLRAWSESTELPAELRDVIARSGWTQEMVVLGHLLHLVAQFRGAPPNE